MKRNSRGFTAIEILIVVLIIAILTAIAVPNMINARAQSQAKTCVQNLWQMEQAKEEFSMANRLNDGDLVTIDQLCPDYIHSNPVCPSGGTYAVNPVGKNPTCTIGGAHTLQGSGMNETAG